MVATSTVIAVGITLCVCLIGPIIAYVVYGLRNKGKKVWQAGLLGAAGFFVMQIVIRSTILGVLSMNPKFIAFSTNHYILYCLILAFTAGLFEVVGRYAVAKIMQKNLTFERGIAAGIGHGGIEAIVVVGMTYVNNLIYIAMINAGLFDGIVAQTEAMGVDTASLIAVKEALIHTSAGIFLLAGYERILTVILHIALSLLVCWFVSRQKDMVGIGICLLCHWAVDFIVPVLNGLSTEYMGNVISVSMAYTFVYIFLTAVAIASFVGIRYIKKQWT